jgi:hypothetical protein
MKALTSSCRCTYTKEAQNVPHKKTFLLSLPFLAVIFFDIFKKITLVFSIFPFLFHATLISKRKEGVKK